MPRAPRKRDREPDSAKLRDVALAVGLWALAFLHRALFLQSNVDRAWGFTVFYEGDAETFYNFARAILAGVPYDGGIPFHPPLWPQVLSWIHRLVGAGAPSASVPHFAVKLWTAALGALVAPLLFLLLRRYFGRGVALLAALLATYSFALYVVSVAPVTESLYTVLLLGALWSFSASPSSLGAGAPTATRAWGMRVLLGVILGLLCLTRAEGALVAATLVGVGLLSEFRAATDGSGVDGPPRGARTVGARTRGARRPGARNLGARILPWFACVATLGLVLLPWTVRNARALDAVNARFGAQMEEPLPTFVPITAYGPLNFALANNELADGTFSRAVLTSRAESATLDITDPQHLRYFLHGYGIGWDWIRNHPLDFCRLVLRKWSLFLDVGRLGWTQWNLPAGLTGTRRPVDMFVPDSPIAAWVLFPLVLLGWFAQLRAGGTARRWALLVLLLTGGGLITTGFFFGYARLGATYLPLWFSCLASALGLLATRAQRLGTIPSPPARLRVLLVGLPLAFLLALEIWGATGDRNFNATGTQLEGASHLNPHDTMRLEVIPRGEDRVPTR